MIRQHDVQIVAEDDGDLVAEGTFRVVLTRSYRVVTAIDVPDSALGPLHLVFAVSPESILAQATTFQTAGLFDHIGHDLSHSFAKAAEGTFNAGSKVATTLARPAFELTKASAAATALVVAKAAPFMPEKDRKKVEAASRMIMRAHLGDVTAQKFIRDVGNAAKAGQHVAQKAGDAFIDAHKAMLHVLDTPMALLASKLPPQVGGVIRGIDPLQKLDKMADKLKKGDFEGLKKDIESDAKAAQGVISLIPGIGTGISAAIGVGVGILEGGGALDVAITAAYGAIPIPPGIRQITDAVLGAVLSLIHHPHDLSDALIAGARNAVPAGVPRDVFDTLANLIFHHMPVAKAAGKLVDTYVERYAGGAPIQGIGSAAADMADAAMHHRNVGVAATEAVGDMARRNAPGALGEVIAGAANVGAAAIQHKNVGAAITDAVGGAARKVAPGALGEVIAGAASVGGAAIQHKNVGAAVSDVVGGAARKIAPGAVGEALAGAAHVAGAVAQGKNVGAAVSDAVGGAARKVAPGALGEGLAGAAQIAGAAAQGKNVGAAFGAAVGGAAQRVAPGALGNTLAGAAQIAGAAAAGKNAFAAAGDAARRIAPGALGQGLGAAADIAGAAGSGKSPLRAASDIVVRQIPGGVASAVAKYLPDGILHGASLPGALASALPMRGAIPLPASTVPLLPAAAVSAVSAITSAVPLLGPAPTASPEGTQS